MKKLLNRKSGFRIFSGMLLSMNFLMAVLPLFVFFTLKYYLRYVLEIETPINSGFYLWVCFLTLFRLFYFFVFCLEQIFQTGDGKNTFNWFFTKYISIFFHVTLGFSIDYWILFQINNANFSGVTSTKLLEQFFDFFYFSFMNITTVGNSGILAVSRFAQAYTMLEITMGFILIGYILGSFTEVQNSLRKKRSIFGK